jgi:hypothetical protein
MIARPKIKVSLAFFTEVADLSEPILYSEEI